MGEDGSSLFFGAGVGSPQLSETHPLNLKMEMDLHCFTTRTKGTVWSQSLSMDFVFRIYSRFHSSTLYFYRSKGNFFSDE